MMMMDTKNNNQNPQIMINMATMYTIKDIVEIFLNKRIKRSTIVHHMCVIIAYIYVVQVLTTDASMEAVFKCLIGYGIFTTLDFPYDIYLALRFFIHKQGHLHHIFKHCIFLHNAVCLFLNLSWQIFFLTSSPSTFYNPSSSIPTMLVSVLVYFLLMAGWVQEEFIVFDHVWKLL